MEDFNLGKLKFGKNDGKNEARLAEFEDLFYDYDNIYCKALDEFNFLIIGRKGTGKTLLAEYIRKQSAKVGNWICTLDNNKKFNIEHLKMLKTQNTIPTEEYITIWEWIILIELSKLIVENFNNKESINYQTLKDFLEKNNFSLKLSSSKTIEITSKQKINGSLKAKIPLLNSVEGEIGKEVEGEIKKISGSYLEYIESLEEIVFNLLKEEPKIKYTIMYDELDSKFLNNEDYKNNIISLLKIAKDLNEKFLDENLSVKIMIFLREDIFSILNDYDLNKIKEDCGISIDWGDNTENSPLVEMTLNKIKKSYSAFSELTNKELIEKLFPRKKDILINKKYNKRMSVFEYILTRTFLRPRDVITYFNKIIETNREETKITWDQVFSSEKKYSTYFKGEIRNELKGHLNDEEIEKTFSLFYNFSKITFRFTELEKFYLQKKDEIGEIDLKKCLGLFFKFGAIGNQRYDVNKKRPFIKWNYREKNIEINYEEQIRIHSGLWKELNLN